MKSRIKDQEIKIRVTTHQKEQLKKMAASSKSMSAYILEKTLPPESNIQNAIIDTVEALDLLNTIILETEKSRDEPLKRRIKHIVDRMVQNGH